MNKIFKREKVTFKVLETTKCCHSFACFMSGLSSGTRLSKSVSFFIENKRGQRWDWCPTIPFADTSPVTSFLLLSPVFNISTTFQSFNDLESMCVFGSVWWLVLTVCNLKSRDYSGVFEDECLDWCGKTHLECEWCHCMGQVLSSVRVERVSWIVNIWFCSLLWTVVVKGPTLVAVTSLMW